MTYFWQNPAGTPPITEMIDRAWAVSAANARRGTGPYGRFLPGEITDEVRDCKVRSNAAEQALRWLAEAKALVEVHHLPEVDERVQHMMKQGTAWLRYATSEKRPAREPKRFPGLKWDAPS